MKKVLSTVAALGLVVGVASTASALEFSASGYYDMTGTYTSQSSARNDLNDGATPAVNYGQSIASKRTIAGEKADSSDAWIEHQFVIKPTMKVNDKIAVKSVIYLAGTSDEVAAGNTADGFNHAEDNANRGVDFQHIYMDYKSPIGLIRLGRQPGGAYFGDWADRTGGADRLRWFSNDLGGGHKLSFFLQKYVDGSASAVSSDDDNDLYSFGGFKKSKDLTYSLWLDYFRDHSDIDPADPVSVPGIYATEKYRLKGYYKQKFGNMHAMFEFEYWTGDTTRDGVETKDISSLGFIAEYGMTMDKVDLNFMGFYSSGDDSDVGTDTEQHMSGTYGLGANFAPLTVLTNTDTRLLTGSAGAGANAAMVRAGVIAIVATADMAVSDTVTLHGGMGYAMAEAEMTGFDDEYGWEIDLGLSYKLLDNLTYSADAGYLMSGDFFKGNTAAQAAGQDAEDVYLFTNGISMTF